MHHARVAAPAAPARPSFLSPRRRATPSRRRAVASSSSSVFSRDADDDDDDPSRRVLAIDVGTSALKASLLSPSGRTLASSSTPYATGTTRPRAHPGAVEQDPDEWVNAFARTARDVLADDDDSGVVVAGVALSGQMQNVVFAKGGRAIRPALLYSDVRATAEAAAIEDALGGADAISRVLHNHKGAAGCLSKWIWAAKRERRVVEAADAILLGAHSYLAHVLTRGDASACDATTASTTGMLAPLNGDRDGRDGSRPRWATDVLGAFDGVDPRKLPALIAGRTPAAVGAIDDAVADALELPKALRGARVFHGVGDLASTTIGATGWDLGDGGAREYLYLGTSGWIARTCAAQDDDANSSSSSADGVFELLHPDPRLRIVASSMVTAGGAAEWARAAFLGSSRTGNNSLADLDALAASAPPGSGGVLFLPHLAGERSPFTDANARGGFVNLSMKSDAAAMARAVLEGVAYNYRSLSIALGSEGEGRGGERRGRGGALPVVGGGARSALWTRTLADVLNRPVRPVADATEIAARGAAAGVFVACGSWGSDGEPPRGYFPVDDDASDLSDDDGVVYPDAENAEAHARNHEVFAKLHAAIKTSGVDALAN